MTAEPGAGLFSGLFARGTVASVTSDQALLQAMLDFELALVRALVRCDLAPPEASQQVSQASDATQFDIADLGRQAADQATPVPALLTALRSRLPSPARDVLHTGATSQDVLDTAIMLVARRGLDVLLRDLSAAARACAGLVRAHSHTVLAGRTLLQQASPLPFGVKAAGWLVALEETAGELERVRTGVLALQFGGAVGTLAPLGDRGLDVAAALGDELGLPVPPVPWHTNRFRPARVAGALGAALGVMGKVARDVVLLAQTEVGEAAESGGDGRGGSSTMPQKRNPVAAIAVLACAGQAPGLVAAVFGAMAHEHERGAGSWQAEWQPLLTLLRLAGSAADALTACLDGLELAPERMRENLEQSGGAVMSESVVTALTPGLGRSAAQDLVKTLTRDARRGGVAFDVALRASAEAIEVLGEAGIERALSPEGYRGVSDALIERALAVHAAGTGTPW